MAAKLQYLIFTSITHTSSHLPAASQNSFYKLPHHKYSKSNLQSTHTSIYIFSPRFTTSSELYFSLCKLQMYHIISLCCNSPGSSACFPLLIGITCKRLFFFFKKHLLLNTHKNLAAPASVVIFYSFSEAIILPCPDCKYQGSNDLFVG